MEQLSSPPINYPLGVVGKQRKRKGTEVKVYDFTRAQKHEIRRVGETGMSVCVYILYIWGAFQVPLYYMCV